MLRTARPIGAQPFALAFMVDLGCARRGLDKPPAGRADKKPTGLLKIGIARDALLSLPPGSIRIKGLPMPGGGVFGRTDQARAAAGITLEHAEARPLAVLVDPADQEVTGVDQAAHRFGFFRRLRAASGSVAARAMISFKV